MAMIERGGVASVYVDGAYYEVSAEIDVKEGGYVRTVVIKSDGVAGYTSKWVGPEVTMEMLDGPAVSVAGIRAINGQTLQISLNNGKTYQLFSATLVDEPTIKIAEGKIQGVKFTGLRCQELAAGTAL